MASDEIFVLLREDESGTAPDWQVEWLCTDLESAITYLTNEGAEEVHRSILEHGADDEDQRVWRNEEEDFTYRIERWQMEPDFGYLFRGVVEREEVPHGQ